MTLIRTAGRQRERAFACLRQWLELALRELKQRIKDLVVVLPSRATERSRSELSGLLAKLGVSARFLSEPIAAALGCGLVLDRPCRIQIAGFDERRLELSVHELRRMRRIGIVSRSLARASTELGMTEVDRCASTTCSCSVRA